MWFPPYFYSRFGCRRLWGVVYRVLGRPLQVMVGPSYATGNPPVLSVTLVYFCQTVAWIRIPLGMKVGFGPGDIMLDGNPALPRKEAQQPRPTFRPMSIAAKRSPISATAEFLYKRSPQNTGHYAMGPLSVVYVTLV